ncbi:MAG: epoxyqueuosine reductase QueH, partial [bacterium]
MEQKVDYNKLMEAQIETLGREKPPLLLHACCAPCSSAVLERLEPHFRLVIYYYNPNTWPQEEYDKRFDELPKLLRAANLTHIELIKAEYKEAEFFSAVRGLEAEPEGGRRCAPCFTLRLKKTAQEAKRLGIDLYATTLSVSPHKNAKLLNELGL